MRVLVDTNILISSVMFPDSKPAQALLRVVESHEMILCEQNIYEFYEVINRKLPRLLPSAETLLSELSYELIPAIKDGGADMRDKKDQPILNSAIVYDVDVILTGDKDFLLSDIDKPKCMTAAEFLEQH